MMNKETCGSCRLACSISGTTDGWFNMKCSKDGTMNSANHQCHTEKWEPYPYSDSCDRHKAEKDKLSYGSLQEEVAVQERLSHTTLDHGNGLGSR